MLLGGYEVKSVIIIFPLFLVLLHFLHSHRRRFADVFLTRMHLRREAKSKYSAFISKRTSCLHACVLSRRMEAHDGITIFSHFSRYPGQLNRVAYTDRANWIL